VIDDDGGGGGVCCVFAGTFWAYITTAVLAKTTKRKMLRTESIATTGIL
jgi:hypothetical protein